MDKEYTPDKSLIETPVQYMCGDPKERAYKSPEVEVYGLKGPEGVSAGLGADPVLVYADITPNRANDLPSDPKLFKGNSPER
jgi:hypothetical protein